MIRWITDAIGTAAWDKAGAVPDVLRVDVRDLVDKVGNGGETVAAKLASGLAGLKGGRRVVFCCEHGMSRSNAVAAGLLAVSEKIPFGEAVRRVVEATGENQIKVEVLADVRAAVEAAAAGAGTLPPSGRRVLVTGGSGNLGRAVAARLSARAPTHRDLDVLSGPVLLDLFVKEHGITDVVHYAAPRVQATTAAIGESVAMLRNLVDVCCGNRVRLVFPSSSDVFAGYRAEGLLADENLPLLPKGHRGETKYLCELLLRHYERNNGLRCTVVRSCPVYGGGDKPAFLAGFARKARAGEVITTHRYLNGPPQLDMLHINDYAEAVATVVESGRTGVFHVGTGQLTATPAMAQHIIEALGSPSQIREDPVRDYACNLAMDASRIRAELGWSPTLGVIEGIGAWLGGSQGPPPRAANYQEGR